MVLAEEEADAGPRDSAARRERLCVATRTVKQVEEMIRFVIGPDDVVVPDLKCRLPGRGVWVTATRDALAGAVNGIPSPGDSNGPSAHRLIWWS